MSHFRSLLLSPVLGGLLLSFASSALLAQQPRIALCAAEASSTSCNFLDPQTRLLATNLFSAVDIINVTAAGGGTPTLAQLLQYDAIMCWTNSTPASNVAWGDVLADYVDAGGGVVVTVFANSTLTAGRNIDGRWQNGYEVIVDRSGNSSGANATLGTVHVPGHPVMTGVTAFTGGTVGSRPNGTALEVGATLIAEWSNGKVLVAAGASPQRIDLGFFPPNSACSGSGWALGGDQLMANALLYVARPAVYGPTAAGCAGTSGVPTIAAAPGSRPLLGTTLNVTIGNLPLSQAIVALGFSDTQFGAIPLPFDLTPINMPGCFLRTDILLSTAVAGSGNTASWSLPVPNVGPLNGLVFFNQAFALDPAANPTGLTVSNLARGRLGVY